MSHQGIKNRIYGNAANQVFPSSKKALEARYSINFPLRSEVTV